MVKCGIVFVGNEAAVEEIRESKTKTRKQTTT